MVYNKGEVGNKVVDRWLGLGMSVPNVRASQQGGALAFQAHQSLTILFTIFCSNLQKIAYFVFYTGSYFSFVP